MAAVPTIQQFVVFRFPCLLEGLFRTGHTFPRGRSPNSLRTDTGLLQLMAHRPIAIDRARADGSAEGAGGVGPGPANDDGGCGACIDQVVVPTVPPRPSARDKDEGRYRVVNERRLLIPTEFQQKPCVYI